MKDLLVLLLPVFLTPTNYSEMLRKLASFAFWEAWLITFLLRDIPTVDALFMRIEGYGHLGIFLSVIPNHSSLNLFGLAIALAVAGLSYATQLHNKLSDILGIRSRFDREYILAPLAQLVGVSLTQDQIDGLKSDRHSLMRKVYYKYTSSRSDHPLVDKHDIEHALGAWSWFWVFVEGAFFFGIAAFLSAILNACSSAFWIALIAVVYLVLASISYPRLRHYARVQIEAIAADQKAPTEVRDVFNAI